MNRLDLLISAEDQAFFTDFVCDVSNACRYSKMSAELRQQTPNTLSFDPVKPGGLKSYPAVWIQDFTMIFSAGFLPPECGLDHLRLILQTQNGEQAWPLEKAAVVPHWAIADHILFDGKPVFFPGTYSSGPDQGGEPWGLRPPYNNYFDVIWLTSMLVQRLPQGKALLQEMIGNLSVYERLQRAFHVPPVDEHGIVYTRTEDRAVGFIFCDSIYMTEKLLMATALRCRAARQMRDLATLSGNTREAEAYALEAKRALATLGETFIHESGWLRACTGVSSQPDVFGTLYALYSGILDPQHQKRALKAVLDGLEQGQIEQDGALRHVPLNHSFSPGTAWERTPTVNNYYQNGAYWHLPAGWLTAILHDTKPELARTFFARYLAHMKKEDFRKNSGAFAPWEWLVDTQRSDGCPVFGPSATLPYAVLTGLA